MFIDKHITPKLGKIRLDAAVREKLILSGPAMLGHNNAGFTLATYTHTTTAAQHQAAAIMGSLVSTGIAPENTDSSLRSE